MNKREEIENEEDEEIIKNSQNKFKKSKKNLEEKYLLSTFTSSSSSPPPPPSSTSPLKDSFFHSFLYHFLESQSHSSIWRRHAENQLINHKILHKSLSQNGEIHTSSLLSSYFVLLKAIIGGGIFTLPYAISKCGFLFGFFLMLFTCLMTCIALHLLACCTQKVHPASFYAVAKLTMPKAIILIDLSISLGCIGTGVAYLIIIGSLIPEVLLQFQLNGLWIDKQLWISIAFFIAAPICYFHRISAFKWTSLIADISIVFVVFIILLYSIPGTGLIACSDSSSISSNTGTNQDDINLDNCSGKTVIATISLETLKVLGIFVGVFSCSVVCYTLLSFFMIKFLSSLN